MSDLEAMLMAVTCCLESSQLMPCQSQYDVEEDHPGGLGEIELISFDIAWLSSAAEIERRRRIDTSWRRRWWFVFWVAIATPKCVCFVCV